VPSADMTESVVYSGNEAVFMNVSQQ